MWCRLFVHHPSGIRSRFCVAGSGTCWQRGSPQKHLSTIIAAVHKVTHQAIEKRSAKQNAKTSDYRWSQKVLLKSRIQTYTEVMLLNHHFWASK